MQRGRFFGAAWLWVLATAAGAQPVEVRHVQRSMHRWMVARSETGAVLARGEFTQVAEGDAVSMRLTYHFADGSVDDEETRYTQRGTFQLVSNHHVETGPFFTRQVDTTVDAASGTVSMRSVDSAGKPQVVSQRMALPADLANGFVGTLLLNVPPAAAPFRVGLLAPVGRGRVISLLISPEGEQPFQMGGQPMKAAVFRIHPELGGMVGWLASMLGLQPKDVMVWVLEGEEPAVVRIVGQLGGAGPVVSSELEGASFER